MIHSGGSRYSTVALTHHTQWMAGKVRLARLLPSVVVTTLRTAAALLILLAAVLITTPVVSERTAPGIGAGSLGGTRHGN